MIGLEVELMQSASRIDALSLNMEVVEIISTGELEVLSLHLILQSRLWPLYTTWYLVKDT